MLDCVKSHLTSFPPEPEYFSAAPQRISVRSADLLFGGHPLYQKPAARKVPQRKLWQGETLLLPVKIVGNIDVFSLLTTVHHAKMAAGGLEIPVPGLLAVARNVRISQNRTTGSLKLLRLMKKRMRLSENNRRFHKFKQDRLLFSPFHSSQEVSLSGSRGCCCPAVVPKLVARQRSWAFLRKRRSKRHFHLLRTGSWIFFFRLGPLPRRSSS